jgi:hypothetical protein
MKNSCFIPFNGKNVIGKDSESDTIDLSKNYTVENNFIKPLYSLIDLISQELSSMGVSSDMHICNNISSEIAFLFNYQKRDK